MNLTKDNLLVIFNTITDCCIRYVQENPDSKNNDILYKISSELHDTFKSMLKQFDDLKVIKMYINKLKFNPLYLSEQFTIDDVVSTYEICVNVVESNVVVACYQNCLCKNGFFINDIFKITLTKDRL